MKEQLWIFTVRYWPEGTRDARRSAIVGPARASTVEAALHLSSFPESVRREVRADGVVRKFVDGTLDPEVTGYYAPLSVAASASWLVCIGSVQAVVS